MARYKPVVRDGIFLPVILAEQIQPGTFEFALDHLIDHELDLSALDAKFNNDETDASAYDPRVMLKIVLLAYSHGLISSRKIGQTCTHNVLFIALSGDSQPSYTHIARFVRDLGPDIQVLFSQVLLSASSARPCSPSTAVRLPANPKKSAAAPTPSWHITAAKCRRTS